MSDKKRTDLLGNPICLGSLVTFSVSVGNSSSKLRYGRVVGYDEIRKDLLIEGGNCARKMKRKHFECIVINMPYLEDKINLKDVLD